ncbi:energy transducer TonB [Sphingomonas sp. MMS24-J13]|uniref:energy transducer TonB n=1 Tax=Sphingomonas sp. MMS24-J13 TaxID=3238686 RepID=UPI00384E0DE0
MPKVLLGCLLLAMPTIARAADPWMPTTPWSLNIGPAECTMTRAFASGSNRLSVSLVRGVLGQNRILVAMPPALHDQIGGRGTISVPGTPPANIQIVQGLTSGSAWVIGASIDRATLAPFLSARDLTISGGKTSLTVALGGAPDVVDAVQKCVDDRLRAWKIDPAEANNDVHPDPDAPKPGPSTWLTNEDYPQEALRARQQGTVFMIFRVETDGNIKDCRVIQSSGSDALDTAACAMIRTRGKYRPLVDHNGKPAVTWQSLRFRWTLPR